MYTNTTNIEAKMGPLTAAQTAYFDDILDNSIDQEINYLTGTQFGSEEVVDVYVEDLDGTNTLVIPTMHDVTAVTYVYPDGTQEVVPTEDWYAWPRGYTSEKTYAIRHKNGTFNDDEFGSYKITGKLGHSEVPADIINVANEMASGTLQARIDGVKSERVGDWSQTFADPNRLSPDSQSTLARYMRLSRSV